MVKSPTNTLPPKGRFALKPVALDQKLGIIYGALFMVFATAFFAISNVCVKLLTPYYDVSQVLGIRSLVSFLVIAAAIWPRTGFQVYKTEVPLSHLARGMSQTVSQALTVLALSLLPLATVTSIGFSSAIWAVMFAAMFLREKLSATRVMALFLGLVGIMTIVNPSHATIDIGVLFALGNAVMYGSVMVAVRAMSKTESADTLLVWQMTLVCLGHSLLLLIGFKQPDMLGLLIFVVCGVANAIGQIMWTKALHLASVSVVSPIYYSLMVWSVVFGAIVLGEVPNILVLLGCGIVLAAGALIIFEKRPG